MPDSTSHRWAPEWPNRIVAAAREKGFTDLTQLLASMPCKPYADVVAFLDGQFAPMQLISAQYQEARQRNFVRDAAKDALCRNITEKLPGGWGCGPNADYQGVSALVDWSTELQVSGGCPELEPMLRQLRKGFHPPVGWIPLGPDDPEIARVFEEYWPVSST